MIKERDVETHWERYATRYLEDDTALVARQYVLPSGRRADLVFLSHLGIFGRDGPRFAVTVVELKLDKVDLSAVCQLVDYLDEMSSMTGYVDLVLRGVLVGATFTQKALKMIRQMPHIRTSLWGFDVWSEAVACWGDPPDHVWDNDVPDRKHYRKVDDGLGALVRAASREIATNRGRRLPVRIQETPAAFALIPPPEAAA